MYGCTGPNLPQYRFMYFKVILVDCREVQVPTCRMQYNTFMYLKVSLAEFTKKYIVQCMYELNVSKKNQIYHETIVSR